MTLGSLLVERDEAKYIREKIKKDLGLSSRDVSVKTQQGGYSSAVNVKIKTKKGLAKMQEIEAIGNSKESIDRDERTGEILMGGNTYVFVDIDYKFKSKIEDDIQKEYIKQAKGSTTNNVVLYGTFEVRPTSNGNPYVGLVKGGTTMEVRDLNYVGSSVMALINKSKDDSLYAKIK